MCDLSSEKSKLHHEKQHLKELITRLSSVSSDYSRWIDVLETQNDEYTSIHDKILEWKDILQRANDGLLSNDFKIPEYKFKNAHEQTLYIQFETILNQIFEIQRRGYNAKHDLEPIKSNISMLEELKRELDDIDKIYNLVHQELLNNNNKQFQFQHHKENIESKRLGAYMEFEDLSTHADTLSYNDFYHELERQQDALDTYHTQQRMLEGKKSFIEIALELSNYQKINPEMIYLI